MRHLIILLILFSVQAMYAQESLPPRHLLIKKDSTYLVVDDTPGCWYTFELKADTMGLIGDNMYYFDHKTIQFGGFFFDNGRFMGATESRRAEVNALHSHRDWELKNHLNSSQDKLYYGEKFYLNNSGKPFLIWWFKVPENKTRTRKKESSDPGKETIYQLYLDCITLGNTCVSVNIPVMEDEELIKEVRRMTEIANTFTSYADTIDLDVLYDRTLKGNPYTFMDKSGQLAFELPDWYSVTRSNLDYCLEGAFPEKDNIVDAATIRWECKSDSSGFTEFIERYEHKGEKHNYILLVNNDRTRREFFSSRDPFFYYQSIFLDCKDMFFYIQFYSTRTTYEHNLKKLEELISKIINHSWAEASNSSLFH